MKDYIQIIEDNKENLFKTIGELVAIRSVAGEAVGDMPFGEGVQKALDYTLSMAEKDGFVVKNVDNYGAHIDFPGETDDIVAMVGHLDIVPEGDLSNWNTDPFKCEVIDGKMYGRGVLDDKGPVVIGYYAMKALREAGFKPNKTIRIILGCDEEDAWEGMNYYMAREKAPVAGFSPDADFPPIYAEKGLIQFALKKTIDNASKEGIALLSLEGGSVPNAVPDSAVAKLRTGESFDIIKKTLEDVASKCNYDVTFDGDENLLTITVKGVSAHAAHPSLGVNAISIIFKLLGLVEFANADVNDVVKFYNENVGFNLHGDNAGCGLEDEPSGKQSYNAGLIKIDADEFILTVDSRFPVTCEVEDVYKGIESHAAANGLTVERLDYLAPLYKPIDDPLVVTLMESYKNYTGDTEAKPLVIGGATYARAVPNTVAFGPVMPGLDDMCHQPNEYMRVSDIMTSAKIFAEVLYKLAK